MTPEELDFYMHVRSNGDEKLLVMSVNMGRVHYFSEEFAAHRRIIDEGESWTARMAKTDEYKKYCIFTMHNMELYRMVEHFFGKKYRRRYIFLLCQELKSRIKFRKSVIREANLNQCYHLKNIPVYAYAALPFYVSYKAARKLAKIVLPRKVLTALKKFRYNQLSALSYDYALVSLNYTTLSHNNNTFRKITPLPQTYTGRGIFVREYPEEIAA